jgi:hypothetical protein
MMSLLVKSIHHVGVLIIKGFLNQFNIPSQVGANYKRISWTIAAENKKLDFFLFGDLEIAENFCSEADDQEMHNFLIWHLKIM